MTQRKTILVAPLNWGLGHATRCIPIINELIDHKFKVIIASDGEALALLKKEFPSILAIELPSYNILYPKKGKHLKWKLLKQTPHIIKNITAEKKAVATIVDTYSIKGIISDNRWGARHNNVYSVFLTHQITVLSGATSFLSTLLHRRLIKKFDECWIPDNATSENLSGKLSHNDNLSFTKKFIGPLSRMTYKDLPKKYDILILLSGPEPQRTILEEKLYSEFKDSDKEILMVRGVIEKEETITTHGNIKIINYLKTDRLSVAINESDLIISRSGYTTIMDLSVLHKKAFFIPTPGQYEQKYLAKRLKEQGRVPFCNQDEFTAKHLTEIPLFKGLENIQNAQDFSKLFSLFHGE